MKVLGGDWPAGCNVSLQQHKIPELLFKGSLWKGVPVDQIESAELVTQENHTSILAKIGWGAIGAGAFGPVGLLAGVLGGGNRTSMVMAVKFKDGRSVLLEGKSKDLIPLLGAGFTKQSKV